MWIPRVFTALVLYVVIIAVLVVSQPALLFDAKGRPKTFGLGMKRGSSILAPSFLFPLLAMILYMFVIWLRLMLG